MVKHRYTCIRWWPADSRQGFIIWFRVLGYGLHIERQKPPRQKLFSERYGYKKALYLLGYRFEILKP